MKILATGAAAFISYHLCKVLASSGDDIVGIDNMNTYYGFALKEARVVQNRFFKNYQHKQLSILDKTKLEYVFKNNAFDRAIHLATQAGIRYSINNPMEVLNNIAGMINVLDMCRKYNIRIIYTSSSSVYGNGKRYPVKEEQSNDKLISPYAVSKRCCELLAASYSEIYGITW